MSLIDEIHNQKPAIRSVMFVLSLSIVVVIIGFVGFTALQRDSFMAFHTDPAEQEAFLEQQNSSVPNPLAAIARIAGLLTARIGSLFGFDSSAGLPAGQAGFDRNARQDTMQGDPHLLPLSQ